MAKFRCRCGELLSTVECSNDIELRVYTNKEWDEILDMIYTENTDSLHIPLPKKDVWKCPKCKRVYVFDYGYVPPIAVYRLEE